MATDDGLRHKTKRALYWKFFDMLSAQGMQFMVGIFMARLLSPDDYGVAAIPGIFLSVAGIFANAGFGTAMIRKPRLTEEDLATAFYYSLGMGVLIYTAVFCCSPLIADFYGKPVLRPLMRVTALGFLVGPLGAAQGILMTRQMNFKTPTQVGIVIKLISGAIGISMAYAGYGVWALVISSLLSGWIGLGITWYIVRWYPKCGWSRESFKYLWGFGNKLMASQLFNSLYTNVVPGFIGKYYSPAELGLYNRADGYAMLPSLSIISTVQSVTFPALSKVQDDIEKLRNAYRQILRDIAFVVFPLMMGLAALARPLIVALITDKWIACVVLLQLICFARMWQPIHSINLNLLNVKGRSDLFLRLEFIKKGYGVCIIAATIPFGLTVFCIGNIISSVVELAVNTYYTGKLTGHGFVHQMRDLGPTFLLAVSMFAVVYGLTFVIPGEWAQIAVGVPAGALVYLGGAWLMRFREIKDALYMLKR